MNIDKENTLEDNKDPSKKYEPNDFIKTGIFIGYSPFCQDVIKHLNKELGEKRGIKYYICTRNGNDEQVTFTIESPKKRNLLTIQPNRTLQHVKKLEIRDQNNYPNPFLKKITALEELGEVISRVESLLEDIQ